MHLKMMKKLALVFAAILLLTSGGCTTGTGLLDLGLMLMQFLPMLL